LIRSSEAARERAKKLEPPERNREKPNLFFGKSSEILKNFPEVKALQEQFPLP